MVGNLDHIPEQAFYIVGNLDEALEKAMIRIQVTSKKLPLELFNVVLFRLNKQDSISDA